MSKTYFNIYQAMNGGIYLMIGKKVTELTVSQILDLSIDVYDLDDFDYDMYCSRYKK